MNQSIRQMGAVFGVALVVVLVGRAFGSAALESFRIHFLALLTGGLATALLSLPIDTRPARAGLHIQPQPATPPTAKQLAG